MPGARKQVAALPWRKKQGQVDILLVTSRETARWVIPKGWPMKGVKDSEAGAIEAYEEAGVEGATERKPFGRYDYVKRNPEGDVRCTVAVFPLLVENERKAWPEANVRQRRWFAATEASAAVHEAGLRDLILAFAATQGG